MPFDQTRLDRSFNQTRSIFDKFVYRPDNNDVITDMQVPGYFSESRFADEEDWVGSLIEIDIPTGLFIGKVLSDGAVVVLFDSNKMGLPTEVLFAFSTATQAPVALDSPIFVEYGAAQGAPTDPVQIAANGLVTINQAGAYNFRTILSIQRTGSTGEAFLFFRVLVNGSPAGNPIAAQLDAEEITIPLQFDFFDRFNATDTIQVEFYRDSQGTPAANDGSLISYTSTNPPNWGATPSASLRVTRF